MSPVTSGPPQDVFKKKKSGKPKLLVLAFKEEIKEAAPLPTPPPQPSYSPSGPPREEEDVESSLGEEGSIFLLA